MLSLKSSTRCRISFSVMEFVTVWVGVGCADAEENIRMKAAEPVTIADRVSTLRRWDNRGKSDIQEPRNGVQLTRIAGRVNPFPHHAKAATALQFRRQNVAGRERWHHHFMLNW